MSSASPSPGLRQYAGTVSWLLVERVVKIVLGLTIGVAVTRYLGPRDFGYLSAALGVAAIATPFATLGLHTFLIREFATEEKNKHPLLASAFVLLLAISTSVFAIILVASLVLPVSSTLRVLIPLVCLSLIPASFMVIPSYFQAMTDGKRVALPRISGYVVGASAKVGLVLTGLPLLYFACAVIAESVVTAALQWRLYARTAGNHILRGIARDQIGRLARAGVPFALLAAAVVAHLKIDVVMLQLLTSPYETGQYAAATLLSEAMYFVPSVFAATALPAFMRSRANHRSAIDETQSYFDLMTLGSLTITISLALIGPWLVIALYGDEFTPARTVFSIHVWAGVFATATVTSQYWCISRGLEHFVLGYTAAAVLCNIALNAAFIPMFGASGAAIATLLSYALTGYAAVAARAETRPCFHMHVRSLALHRSIIRLAASYRRAANRSDAA